MQVCIVLGEGGIVEKNVALILPFVALKNASLFFISLFILTLQEAQVLRLSKDSSVSGMTQTSLVSAKKVSYIKFGRYEGKEI